MRLDDAIGVLTATELMSGHGRGGSAASTSVGACSPSHAWLTNTYSTGRGCSKYAARRLVRGGADRQSDHQDASTPTAQRRSVKPT
jgi:hypothetical protein